MYPYLRKLLFRLDPEKAHDWTIRALQLAQETPGFLSLLHRRKANHPQLAGSIGNLFFPHPVGLAAGFDKNATVYPALAALGFSFVEVGTLTPKPQSGNPPPRMFRLPEYQAIINRMGFNNWGVESAANSLRRLHRPSIPIGINLGKNKDTPNEQAVEDYRQGLHTLYSLGDYFVINISSPNTKGLRDLQKAESLEQLLRILLDERNTLAKKTGTLQPLFLKVAPDLTKESLSEVIQLGLNLGIDGFIAVNTTLSRKGLNHPHAQESGGLSGQPLAASSTEKIRHIYQITKGKVPIIGVGGIFTGEDAYKKIRAGARLIQVYTGMIYRGPSIPKKINEELLALFERDGVRNIEDIVGVDA